MTARWLWCALVQCSPLWEAVLVAAALLIALLLSAQDR